jgi:hypothetical protein
MHDMLLRDKFFSMMSKNGVSYAEEKELGEPARHAPLDDECHGQDHLCSAKGKPVMYQVGHHARHQSNQPIFGVLTQPVPHEWRRDLELGVSTFIESSHVEFLQAAGARVVPIDYRIEPLALQKMLE